MAAGQPALSAEDVIRLLKLEPHPEGGHFRETFRTRGPSNYPHGKQAEPRHV